MSDGDEDYITVSRAACAGALGVFLVAFGAICLVIALAAAAP